MAFCASCVLDGARQRRRRASLGPRGRTATRITSLRGGVMEIDTQYAVKLFFTNSAFVQVYFEAVANAFNAQATEIDIRITSDGQIKPGLLEITVKDNGIGFTDDRFASFRRLTEPTDPYHKGLGRLVYLCYFSAVDVCSVYGDKKRTFAFSNRFNGKSQINAPSEGTGPGPNYGSPDSRETAFGHTRISSRRSCGTGFWRTSFPCFTRRRRAEETLKLAFGCARKRRAPGLLPGRAIHHAARCSNAGMQEFFRRHHRRVRENLHVIHAS